MESRKWEELPRDCLVIIFQKLEVQDLVMSVPLVCKPWYDAALSPLCWQVLNMGNRVGEGKRWYTIFLGDIPLPVRKLFRLLIRKSRGSATKAIFPDYRYLFMKDVGYFLKRCPMLETLALPPVPYGGEKLIIQHVHLWQNLRHLYLRYKRPRFCALLKELSHHCKYLVGLQVCGHLSYKDATAITVNLPKLKYLCLSGSTMDKDTLLCILEGCPELEELLLEDFCFLGSRIDRQVMASAARLKTFKFARSYEGYDVECGHRGEVRFLTHRSFKREEKAIDRLQRELLSIFVS